MQRVTPNVYVQTGQRGCNTGFVVTSDGVVAVDTPMVPADAKKWAVEMAKHGPVRYVINGEAHPDHIAGNCYLGGTLVAHEGTRDVILKSNLDEFRQMFTTGPATGASLDEDFRFRAPDITLNDRLTIYLGRHTFRLMALPGHSPCQVAVHVPEEKVLFTSDNVVTGTPFFFQALPDDWLNTLARYQELDVAKVVPGHGEVQDKSYLLQMGKNIRTWLDTVAAAMKKGMTPAEAQEKLTMAKEFPNLPRDQRTANIIRSNIARIYDYLKNKQQSKAIR